MPKKMIVEQQTM